MRIRVWNNGASIPRTEQVRIFDRFYRGIDARQQAAGSGLGLYVARKIALAHGGTLNLENAPLGVAFIFTIPTAKNETGHDTEIQGIGGR